MFEQHGMFEQHCITKQQASLLSEMQMRDQLQLLMSRELTWWDREAAYQKPAAQDLEQLASQIGVLLSSWYDHSA